MGAGDHQPREAGTAAPASAPPAAEFVAARKVLLDALDALGLHRQALILVGAQALYLQAGEIAGLPVAPYTTDADLAIVPDRLGDAPALPPRPLTKDAQ